MDTPAPIRTTRRTGEQASRRREFGWLARAGIAAIGVVYAIIGVLALKLALGSGGQTTDQQGALQTVAKQPFGKFLLFVLALGLAGYAIWRLTRAAIGHGQEIDDDAKARLEGLISGLAYALLCVTAVGILVGSGGGGAGPDKATAGVLGWPGGRFIVIAAGLGILVGAALEAVTGLTRSFLEDSQTSSMGPRVKPAFTVLGMTGHLARAVIFALIAYFAIKAAIDFDPDKAVGLDGALATLAQAAYGPVLLGAVALGLLAFAAYSIVDARFRRV